MVTIGPQHSHRSVLAASGRPASRSVAWQSIGREGRMTVIAEFGIFMGGLGVFFLGCGLLWWVSLWKERE